MNYEREFGGKPALMKQSLVEHGSLISVNTGEVLADRVVDAYNRYTADFNDTSWRPKQEKILDNRHKFFIQR